MFSLTKMGEVYYVMIIIFILFSFLVVCLLILNLFFYVIYLFMKKKKLIIYLRIIYQFIKFLVIIFYCWQEKIFCSDEFVMIKDGLKAWEMVRNSICIIQIQINK